MGKMECPICGKMFDDMDVMYLDNGNPACPHCVKKEQEENKEEK